MNKILKCKKCSKYTMKPKCSCGGKAVTVKPPKYTLDNKYAKYTRKAKLEKRQKQDLL
ncbi:MAG: Ribosome biogenesis protein Nop10 [Candidatus Woesearchaeota archaeon]|nr:Ribosome biogenesis protein Nop10 [Candidatus Woesearchaeota archaeon]